MPRIHWAQRCKARRSTDGQPCDRWAIRGGYVCPAHGGSLRRTREEAAVRIAQIAAERMFSSVYARWQEAVRRFHTDRILTTSRLLGIPPGEVDRWDIIACHMAHGVPALEHEAPKITDIRPDRRFVPAALRLGAKAQPPPPAPSRPATASRP